MSEHEKTVIGEASPAEHQDETPVVSPATSTAKEILDRHRDHLNQKWQAHGRARRPEAAGTDSNDVTSKGDESSVPQTDEERLLAREVKLMEIKSRRRRARVKKLPRRRYP